MLLFLQKRVSKFMPKKFWDWQKRIIALPKFKVLVKWTKFCLTSLKLALPTLYFRIALLIFLAPHSTTLKNYFITKI